MPVNEFEELLALDDEFTGSLELDEAFQSLETGDLPQFDFDDEL